MIVFTNMSPNAVTSYHTEPQLKDIDAKVDSIKSTDEYKALKADIEANGIKDALVAMSTPTRVCMVEVGEQRLLIARELGLETVPVVCYIRYRGNVPFAYDSAITTQEALDQCFSDPESPGLTMLKTYLEAKICDFRVLSSHV